MAGNYDTLIVSDIDSILVGASYRKQYIITINYLGSNVVFDSLIEGIGSAQGLMERLMFASEVGSSIDCFTDSTIHLQYPTSFHSCRLFQNCIAETTPTVKKPSPEVQVFPNPSNGSFTLSLSNINEKCTIDIFNVLGGKILTETLRSAQGDNLIDLAAQSNGVYFYRIISESGALIGEGKIIIE